MTPPEMRIHASRVHRPEVKRVVTLKSAASAPALGPTHVSPAYARPSDAISSKWNQHFALLYRQLDDYKEGRPLALDFDPAVDDWLTSVLDALNNGREAIALEDLPHQPDQGHPWMFMQISLWLMSHEPDRLVDFLLATHHEPYPSVWRVQDCLHFLAKHLSRSEESRKPIRKQRLLHAFHTLAYRTDGERFRVMNFPVREVLRCCTPDEACDIYHTVSDCQIHVHGFTLLHFADRFAKDGNFELASEALLAAKDHGVMVNRTNFRAACSSVIRSCMSQPEGLRVCLRLVSELVDVGLELNGPICDIIMLNAVDAGDIDTAFGVYRSLVDRGLKPRETTFAILLKACRLNIDDADLLNGVIRDAIDQISVRKSTLVATEILNCLALHHTKHNPDSALRTLTEAYAQLFDTEPLHLLGLPLPSVQQQRATTEPPLPPSPHALVFMISASISRIHTYSSHPDEIFALYTRWRDLVASGAHASISALATTDHLANLFLMAFIRSPSGLIHASRVVRDMQRPLTAPPATVEQCKPTTQTFSIFLHGFTRHNKLQLAEQVLTYMRSKGIEPSKVTWTTLLYGYTRNQDVEGAFETLRRQEAEGHVWDRWTEGGINWLKDRGAVHREMERRKWRREKGLDFTEDLREGLGQRLGEWEVRNEAERAREYGGQEMEEGPRESRGYTPFGDSAGELAEQEQRDA